MHGKGLVAMHIRILKDVNQAANATSYKTSKEIEKES